MSSSDRKKCVLVMDDSILALELSRDALEEADFRVLVATDANELARHLDATAAAGETIDLIILDMQMPEVLGDKLAAGLKTDRGVRVPILLCSGHDEATLAQRARSAAIDGYISKQAGLDAMVARVRSLLQSSDTSV
ncbi:MAG TPA: response regulator [Kofleriaceae bacterium]|nr:response regulator [Kofleriaceae bacterium]